MFNRKTTAESAPVVASEESVAAELRSIAQRCAELAGDLQERGWNVSVGIYPKTAEGPTATVSIYRQRTL